MKVIGKMKLEPSPGFEIRAAVFFKSEHYFIKKPLISIKTIQKEIQSHNEHLIEDYKKVYKENEKTYGNIWCFRSTEHKVSMVKRSKTALHTFDGRRRSINGIEKVP